MRRKLPENQTIKVKQSLMIKILFSSYFFFNRNEKKRQCMCEYTVIKCHLMLIVFGLYLLSKKKRKSGKLIKEGLQIRSYHLVY